MPYIVTANYKNRTSPNKWLVRKEEQSIDKAVAWKQVTADDVVLRKSSELEEGFGCRVVAVAESVRTSNEETPMKEPDSDIVDISFRADYFHTGNHVKIKKFKHLILNDKMSAVL